MASIIPMGKRSASIIVAGVALGSLLLAGSPAGAQSVYAPYVDQRAGYQQQPAAGWGGNNYGWSGHTNTAWDGNTNDPRFDRRDAYQAATDPAGDCFRRADPGRSPIPGKGTGAHRSGRGPDECGRQPVSLGSGNGSTRCRTRPTGTSTAWKIITGPLRAIMATRQGGRTITAVGTEEIMVGKTMTAVGIEEMLVGKAGTVTGTEGIMVGMAITP